MALQNSALSPNQWGDIISGLPTSEPGGTPPSHGHVRRWTGTSPDMIQPALDHHYIVLHLGGAKRVTRCGEGGIAQTDVGEGTVTVVPAGAAFTWRTEGPVDFAHLYVDPKQLSRTVVETFDRDPACVSLVEGVGQEDSLLKALIGAMLARTPLCQGEVDPYLGVLFNTALVQLVSGHSTLPSVSAFAPHALAPWRLRRVTDYVEANLAGELDLDALSEIAGLSRYHFSRMFQRATGRPPYAYVTRRRIEAAKGLLRKTELPLAELAAQVGFHSPGQFSTMFKRATGQNPSRYRNER